MLGIEGVPALRGVGLSINEGEFVTILGTSGGGKTTMLNIIGTIDKPSKGDVYICGLNSDFKRKKFGNWLELETISDNVVMLQSFCSNCKKKPAILL